MKRSCLLVFLLTLTACDPGTHSDDEYRELREVVGDTTIVRSVSGSVWGEERQWRSELTIGTLDGPAETSFGRVRAIAVHTDGRILVMDSQIPTLRVFAADGTYLASWGREGAGPGELAGPDAGLAVLPDGRVVVRDRGNARLQLFSDQGVPVGTWRVITGQYINRRAFGLQGDTLINPDLVNPFDPLPEWRSGLVRIAPDGTVLDTIAIPDTGRRAHRFIARSGGNASERDLPFAPTEHWAWHPDGFVIHGAGDAYALSLLRPERPMRIERQVDPTPVSAAERDQEEERVLNAMRWLDPTWRWNGPDIPTTKPFFSGIWVGGNGRIWVLRDGEAYETEDPDFDPDDPYDTEIRWRQDRVLDAFDPDGRFLGTVPLPRDLDFRVPPVLRGDTMWAVTRGDLGVQRVHRMVLVPDPE